MRCYSSLNGENMKVNNMKLTPKLKKLLTIVNENEDLECGGISQIYFKDRDYSGTKINKRNSTIASWISKLATRGLIHLTHNKLTKYGQFFLKGE